MIQEFSTYFNALPREARREIVPALQWFAAFDKYYEGRETTATDLETEAARSDAPRRLTPDKEARLRAMIVSDIWEPDLRSELVDRVVYAVSTKLVDSTTLKIVIDKAIAAKKEYADTGGRRGKDANWKTIATWLKGVYERNQIKWTSTKGAIEPRPRQRTVADLLGDKTAAEAMGDGGGRVQLGSLKELIDGAREANPSLR